MSTATKAHNALTTVVDFYATALAEGQQREQNLQLLLKQQQEANQTPPSRVEVNAQLVKAARVVVQRWREITVGDAAGSAFGLGDDDMLDLAMAVDKFAAWQLG